MKRIFITILALLSIFAAISAQNIDDALRYSQIFYGGTARFTSMGGAFTALGGDLSSISLNPAGTGVFRSSEFSLTPQLSYNNSTALWNNSSTSNFKYILNLSQVGLVSNLISTGNETGLVSLNAAYSFNKTNNFDESITIAGISDNSSMADYWVSRANGYSKMNIPDDSWAANKTWLIDTLSGSTDQYGTIFSNYGNNTYSVYGQKIRREISSYGFSGEHAFSIGANYSNKYFFGATLGISTIRYTGHYEHLENDVDNEIFDFKNFTYTDHLEARGTGYSLSLGTIIKPVEYLRIGLSLHSPVIYRIREDYFDNFTSNFDTQVDGVDNYHYTNTGIYKYTFTTPFRLNAGVAYQIKKFAIVSADYEFVDYRMSQFSNAVDHESFSDENSNIKDMFKSASNLKFGAEFRLNNVYFRGGYGYYGKAFVQDADNKDLDYKSYSCGIGIRQQNFYFDMAYMVRSGTSKYFMYDDPPYLEAATIKTKKNTFAITAGFKF